MPEQPATDIDKALECLEDDTLTSTLSRCQNYQTIQNSLDNGCNITDTVTKRLLTVCNHDLKEDLKYASNTLGIISSILQRIRLAKCPVLEELTPTALGVLGVLKSTATVGKVQTLQTLCFETVIQFPNETYVGVIKTDISSIYEVFSLYCNQSVPVNIRIWPFKLLLKLLKSLPLGARLKFVEEGLKVWFSKVIPQVMNMIVNNNQAMTSAVSVLELLTNDLENVSYEDCPQWLYTLECLSSPNKYPSVMKSLLETGNPCWYRLWNVFVRLLKQQITSLKCKQGSPINSMLPVVEMAFKMDTTNRCKAFQCWNVLIDNFSKETNETYVNKRIKLLIIPLKSNNAKIEETAMAKFDTWWHLINKFEKRIDKLLELIFVPFLHFCFGNPKVNSEKNIFIPGQMTMKLKRLTVQAFVESVGHVYCDTCVHSSFPQLSNSILSPKNLTHLLSEWMHSLKRVITIIGSKDYEEEGMLQLRCIWNSFLQVTLKLTEDKRNPVIKEIWNVLLLLVEDSATEHGVFNIIFNILLPLMLDESKVLLFNKHSQEEEPMKYIMKILLNTNSKEFYSGSEPSALISKTKIIISRLLDIQTGVIEKFIQEIPADDCGLCLWCALMESINESETEVNVNHLKNLLLWPLENSSSFKNTNIAASTWNSSYMLLKSKLSTTSLNTDISSVISAKKDKNILTMCAVLLLISGYAENKKDNYEVEAKLLAEHLEQIKDHEVKILQSITHVVSLMLTKISDNISLAEYALTSANYTLKLFAEMTSKSDAEIKLVEKLLTSLSTFFEKESHMKLKSIIIERLVSCDLIFDKNESIKRITNKLLVAILDKTNESENTVYTLLKNALKKSEKNVTKVKEFTSPKALAKKSKKKETSIVNTVVENGEEYVVVQSHWKFNPRKLTENQKEKLQKKREDIPALYQDLSQSQDEFKLKSWKADSQDTTTTSSHSKSESNTTADNVSSILKQMSSTDVIPKIMENFFSENRSENNTNAQDTIEDNRSPKSNKKLSLSSPKQPKSPRVALKDRVFQNVKNLLKKSGIPQEQTIDTTDNTDSNRCRTPDLKPKNDSNTTNSAPPMLSLDRPSRLKRKPKKYETDFQELQMKKRRASVSSDSELITSEHNTNPENAMKESQVSVNIVSENSEADVSKNVNQDETNNTAESVLEKVNDDPIETDSDVILIEEDKIEQIEPVEAVPNKELEVKETVKESTAVDSPETKDNQKVVSPVNSTDNVSKETEKNKSNKKERRSRIEKQLAIDTVEGHPLLKETEKRTTRKSVVENPNSVQRKILSEKLNKISQSDSKLEAKTKKKIESSKTKSTKKSDVVKELFSVQDNQPSSLNSSSQSILSQEQPMSEDFIESSQDSSFTTATTSSTNSVGRKTKMLALNNIQNLVKRQKRNTNSHKTILNSSNSCTEVISQDKDDTLFSQNKTNDLTADFDTEPIDKEIVSSDEVIIINDDVVSIEINTQDTNVSINTQNTANADTQPMDPNKFSELDVSGNKILNDRPKTNISSEAETQDLLHDQKSQELPCEVNDQYENDLSSPYKDDDQRNKDFLNNTSEISPIKIMSPIDDEKKSPESSNDYVVVRLSSPVQINGEPFEKSCSPEIFTEDKISLDHQELSPTREKTVVNNSSPSSLLVKKNRPQVRQGGRGAQMLGLCVPDQLQSFINTEKPVESEEPKKNVTTPARRNLKILYNCNENNESNDENSENSEHFLKFKRALPSSDCSPSNPILKRKLVEIADECALSPASKRKRVSFHDPPVSTTVSVQKYIEPLGIRSPQSSTKKLERPTRNGNMKSPKKLENIFKLERALDKTLQSFAEYNVTNSEDIDTSLEPTLSVEVIKTSELNDIEPICPELIDCKDPISNIATELSSPTTKTLLITEFEGKIDTVGDLAKLSELEINRLCIKAPKVKIAKKVLNDYVKVLKTQNLSDLKDISCDTTIDEASKADTTVGPIENMDTITIADSTTVKVTSDSSMQTDVVTKVHFQTQTASLAISRLCQTNESGSKSTRDIVKSCILERADFVNELSANLKRSTKSKIAEDLPLKELCGIAKNKVSSTEDLTEVMDCVLEDNPSNDEQINRLSFLQDYLCQKYDSRELILFCSNLLRKIHDDTL